MDLKGILPALVTPFDQDGEIDFKVLGQLLEHLLAAGVHGFVPMGSTGEYYAMSTQERDDVLRFVKENGTTTDAYDSKANSGRRMNAMRLHFEIIGGSLEASQDLNCMAETRTTLVHGRNERTVTKDLMTGRTRFLLVDDDGRYRIEEHGLEVGSAREHEFRINDGDPLSAWGQTRWVKTIGRGDWQTRTVTKVTMTSTKEEFVLKAELDAYEGEERVYTNNWSQNIKRNLV